MKKIFLIIITGLLLSHVRSAEQNNSELDLSGIKEVMESIITPATNTLWGVENPTTDEQWQILEQAAISTIEAGKLIDRNNPEWKKYNTEMIEAAQNGLEAIRSKNLNDLYFANDVLYPPCENCHMQFHPNM